MMHRFRSLALVAMVLLLAISAGAALPARSAEAADPFTPGSTVVVRAQGDCLRVRETPGLSGRQLTCLAEGTAVVVLPSVVMADGVRWQYVNTGAVSGYVSDQYLAPYTAPSTPPPAATPPPVAAPSCSAMKPTSYRPGLTGFVPSGGGTGMVVWGGGTLAGVELDAATRGCTPKAVWTSRADGELVGYLYGAPDFVNVTWHNAFPDGWLSGGRVLLIVCDDPSNGLVSAASVKTPGGLAPTAAPPTVVAGAKPAPAVSAAAVAIVDEASGALLYQKNGNKKLGPASLTKIATAIIAIEGMEPAAVINSDVDSRTMITSSVMGLLPGDCFVANDLLYGLMLPSGNDVALAIARYEAGSDAAFVNEMNTLVKRLGLNDTSFVDPHGLIEPGNMSSAYDIAMLSRYGMSLSRFRTVVKATSYTARGGRTLTMYNTNSLLTTYSSADGVKTGFNDDAGRTLSVSATKNGHRIYVVLLNAPNREVDGTALLDWAFANHKWP